MTPDTHRHVGAHRELVGSDLYWPDTIRATTEWPARLSVLAGRPIAAFAALRGCKFCDHAKLRLYHRHDHELREPLHRLQHKRRVTAVPGADLQLALVVAVDQA